MKRLPEVLAVGGFDSGARSGIVADVQAVAAMGLRARTAVAAWTAQGDAVLARTEPSPLAQFAAELELALEEGNIAAVKVGMLADAAHLSALLGVLDGMGFSGVLVVDPVFATSSGASLLDEAGWQAMQSALLPRATLITPNRAEAERLLGEKVKTAPIAASRLRARLGVSVLVKGGHFEGNELCDALALADKSDIITLRHAHRPWSKASARGTGCRLASAIAALLARGWNLVDACRFAIEWLTDAPVQLQIEKNP